MPSGVIVAGGRSTRFGDADKAVAELAGVPMIRRVADRLAGVVESLVVNCRDEQTDAIRAAMAGYDHPVRYAVDDEPDRGPMAGIRNGLRAVPDEYAFVAACDMPFLDPDFVAYLFDRAESCDAAVPRLDGWFEPTHAVYRAAAMADACDAALERGDSRVIAPLTDVEYVVVEDEEVDAHADRSTFENVNTREEFEAAAARLS
ncbi:molybdenum cofactor guanylyltransferase [Salinirarus marinus]|uniref:molybdenum cofactor guanylyltransferase n=1 Tax=Salinirarus marinus TaxID=3068310 RepID=UPI003C6C0245